MGFKGEEIVDDRVWVVKAHHPALLKGVLTFDSQKVICLMKNPLDIIYSYAKFNQTMSDSQTDFSIEKEYPEWWDWWVHEQAVNIQKYFDTLFKHCVTEKKNPIYFCRQEDIAVNTKSELTNIMKFMFDMDDLTGTNIERRIDEVCSK